MPAPLRLRRLASCLCGALLAGSCAPGLMKLPAPAGPAADTADALAAAVASCRTINTFSAEIAASGSVGGHGLRGRLLVGLAAPDAARIEAVAPFGQPIFIFVTRRGDATLLLPRDNRVLEHGRPEAVLSAVAGVPLDAAGLRETLTGCAPVPSTSSGRAAGDDWRVVADGARQVYLHREGSSSPWRVAAATFQENGGWRAEYRDHANGLPRSVRLVGTGQRRFDLRLALSQVETNAALGNEVFEVRIPPGAAPISLRELEQSGPLRGAEPGGGSTR